MARFFEQVALQTVILIVLKDKIVTTFHYFTSLCTVLTVLPYILLVFNNLSFACDCSFLNFVLTSLFRRSVLILNDNNYQNDN